MFCIFKLFTIICLEEFCILNGHLICVLICAYMKIMNIEHQALSEHEVGGGGGVWHRKREMYLIKEGKIRVVSRCPFVLNHSTLL